MQLALPPLRTVGHRHLTQSMECTMKFARLGISELICSMYMINHVKFRQQNNFCPQYIMFTIFMTEGGPAFLSFRATSCSQQLPGVLHFPRFFLHVKTALHQVSNPQSARTTQQGSIKLLSFKRGEASLPLTTRISPWHNI